MSDRPNTCPDIFLQRGLLFVEQSSFEEDNRYSSQARGKVSVTATEYFLLLMYWCSHVLEIIHLV